MVLIEIPRICNANEDLRMPDVYMKQITSWSAGPQIFSSPGFTSSARKWHHIHLQYVIYKTFKGELHSRKVC